MFATHNSSVRQTFRTLVRLTLAASVGFAGGWRSCEAAETNQSRLSPAAHAQIVFAVAKERFESDPTNNVAAWEFARAGFDRAEFSTNDTERAAIAEQCIEACRTLIERDPKSLQGHYYLGMNLGQLARTKFLGALKIVSEMEREFKTAAELDEQYDHAGPDRNLGLLYYEAPSFGSIGSRTKARKYLERAAELSPDFPENRLNLAEAYLKWHEKKLLQRELEALEKLWPVAKTKLAGIEWENAWQDWEQRREKLEAKAKGFLKR